MKSTVSIFHNDDVEKAVHGALDQIDGLSELFIGKHVAIKPNDTWASAEDLTPCTQADTVRAVIRFVKGYFPKKITVSGGAGAAETEDVFRLLGIDKVVREEGVEFLDHNRPPFITVNLDYGPQKKVVINEHILGYDTLISLAQHKVHDIATVTLTMKNIAMSYSAADYYGHPRSKRLKEHYFFKDMQSLIAGMCKRFPIDLGIIVGHPAMTGRGPIGGKTFETGLVIASKDFVAADYIGARMLGFEKVAHIQKAESLGLGNASMASIEIAGVPYEEAKRIFDERSMIADEALYRRRRMP